MSRSSRSSGVPPPLELECLSVLWQLQSSTVHEVRNYLSETRPLAYTTVMTVLDRLVKRGAASRRRVGRSFVFQPRISRDAMRHNALTGFVDAFFDGSEEALLTWLRTRAADAELARGVPLPQSESWPVEPDAGPELKSEVAGDDWPTEQK